MRSSGPPALPPPPPQPASPPRAPPAQPMSRGVTFLPLPPTSSPASPASPVPGGISTPRAEGSDWASPVRGLPSPPSSQRDASHGSLLRAFDLSPTTSPRASLVGPPSLHRDQLVASPPEVEPEGAPLTDPLPLPPSPVPSDVGTSPTPPSSPPELHVPLAEAPVHLLGTRRRTASPGASVRPKKVARR